MIQTCLDALRRAIVNVDPRYIDGNECFSDISERSFCYDLYYYWRQELDKEKISGIIVNGEPVKFYNKKKRKWFSPDIVLYEDPQKRCGANLIACEIKRARNAHLEGIKKDLDSLLRMKKGKLHFGHPYQLAVYIITGKAQEEFKSKLKDLVSGGSRKYEEICIITIEVKEGKPETTYNGRLSDFIISK